MLPSGKVDAAWLPQPLGEIAEQRYGAVPLADFDQGSLQDFPFTGYIGTTQWVRTHPDTVAAFLRALTEGQQLADTDRAAVETAMEQYTGISPLVADTMAIDSYPLDDGRAAAAAGRRLDVRVRPDAGREGAVPDRQDDPAGARARPAG